MAEVPILDRMTAFPAPRAGRRGSALAIAAVAGVLFAGGAAGCARERVEARQGITAKYAFRTLSTELEPSVSVLTASVAAEQALRARGYSIARAETTEDAAVVVGRPPRGGDFDRAVVESRVTRTGTLIAIRVEPFGNEAASYAIMDALLMRIGR